MVVRTWSTLHRDRERWRPVSEPGLRQLSPVVLPDFRTTCNRGDKAMEQSDGTSPVETSQASSQAMMMMVMMEQLIITNCNAKNVTLAVGHDT